MDSFIPPPLLFRLPWLFLLSLIPLTTCFQNDPHSPSEKEACPHTVNILYQLRKINDLKEKERDREQCKDREDKYREQAEASLMD